MVLKKRKELQKTENQPIISLKSLAKKPTVEGPLPSTKSKNNRAVSAVKRKSGVTNVYNITFADKIQ